jgi:hypothetical protein
MAQDRQRLVSVLMPTTDRVTTAALLAGGEVAGSGREGWVSLTSPRTSSSLPKLFMARSLVALTFRRPSARGPDFSGGPLGFGLEGLLWTARPR